jgi:hypothetical protein
MGRWIYFGAVSKGGREGWRGCVSEWMLVLWSRDSTYIASSLVGDGRKGGRKGREERKCCWGFGAGWVGGLKEVDDGW